VVADKAGVLARITGILAEHDISIDAVLQRERRRGRKPDRPDHPDPRHRRRPHEEAALAQMQALPTVLAPIVASARKS
jgi:homoserine dehydrogenase